MPFLNPADKKRWREKNREKQRIIANAWRDRQRNSPAEKAKRLASKKITALKRNAKHKARNKAQFLRELASTMKEMRFRIMERDGLVKCWKCGKIAKTEEMYTSKCHRQVHGMCVDCKRAYAKKRRKCNPTKAREESKRAYQQIRQDPARHLRIKVRDRVRARMKSCAKGSSVTNSVDKFLGCTWQQAVEYIEKQFEPGMTWGNHGLKTWHIDHVFPMRMFDLADKDEMKRALHYTNLRPLWATDNLHKSAKIPNEHRPFLL